MTENEEEYEYDIARVRWIDASGGYEAWTMYEELKDWLEHPSPPIESVGVVLENNDDYIVLAMNVPAGPAHHGEANYCMLMKIPKFAVIDLKILTFDMDA